MKDQSKWVCNSCNARNSITHSFCIKCGTQRPKGMQCPKCGAALVPNQNFCFNCGTLIQHNTITDPPISNAYIKKEYKHGRFLEANRKQKNTDQPNSHCTKCGKPINGDMAICEQCLGKISKIWTRSIAAILVVALLSGIAVCCVGSSLPKVKNAEQAISVLKDLGEGWGYENAFAELTEKNTTTIDGDSYYRLQQNYKGIPVYGQTVVYATDSRGIATALSGNVSDISKEISTTPITPQEVIKKYAIQNIKTFFKLYDDFDVHIPELTHSNLCIYSSDNGEQSLAYCIHTVLVRNDESVSYEIVVNAENGNILSYYSDTLFEKESIEINYENHKTTMDISKNNSPNNSPIYSLVDEDRQIEIINANNGILQYEIYASDGKLIYNKEKQEVGHKEEFGMYPKWYSTTRITEPKSEEYPPVFDENGIKLLKGIQITYDYYKKTFSLEGVGAKNQNVWITACYNDYIAENNSDNAYSWGLADQNMHQTLLSFGTENTLSLDTVAHEYTHAVEQKRSAMIYSGESGAIMEALSDIMGELIEEQYHLQKDSTFTVDWIHGNRNIGNPNAGKNPAIYKGIYWGDTTSDYDHGYIHKNSTVISHAAYLMSKEINNAKLAELWYRAMLLMPSNCDFMTCRKLVEWSSLTVDGLTKSQRDCISNAFDTVGIKVSVFDKEQIVDGYLCNLNATLKVYDALGKLHDKYKLIIKGVTSEAQKLGGVPTNFAISYSKELSITKAKSVKLNLPEGYYQFIISDEDYPNEFYSFMVSISDKWVDDLIELYTNFGTLVVKVTEPIDASKREDVPSGKCGDNLTWTLKNGVLTISGTGDMYNYDLPLFKFAPWYEYHDQITSLEIGPGVTSIGDYAFLMCYNLTDIIIPGNIKRIGDDAFHGCSQSFERKLNITIKPGVEVIGSGAFHQCFTLTNIELPDSITYIGDGAFFGCNMKSITIPSNVTYIGGQVFECDGSNVMEEIYFTGDAPQFAADAFAEINAIAYYPANNKSWTVNVLRNYGGNITWIAEGEHLHDGNELSAYIPYVQKAMKVSGYDVSEEYTHGFCSGILIDLDGDNVQELVLHYLEAPLQQDAWWWEEKLSVYDYENNKVVTRLNGVSFGEFGAAGESGYVSILYKSGKPYIMTYNESGETSGSGTIDPNRYGTMTIYDGITCKKVSDYWIDRYNNVVSYKINDKTVDKNRFISEVQQYYDAKVILDYYSLIEFPQMSVSASELLKKMK